MVFSIHKENSDAGENQGRPCWGICAEDGRIFPCVTFEKREIEELLALLNESDVSGEQVEEVIQDFEGLCIYKAMGNW